MGNSHPPFVLRKEKSHTRTTRATWRWVPLQLSITWMLQKCRIRSLPHSFCSCCAPHFHVSRSGTGGLSVGREKLLSDKTRPAGVQGRSTALRRSFGKSSTNFNVTTLDVCVPLEVVVGGITMYHNPCYTKHFWNIAEEIEILKLEWSVQAPGV